MLDVVNAKLFKNDMIERYSPLLDINIFAHFVAELCKGHKTNKFEIQINGMH